MSILLLAACGGAAAPSPDGGLGSDAGLPPTADAEIGDRDAGAGDHDSGLPSGLARTLDVTIRGAISEHDVPGDTGLGVAVIVGGEPVLVTGYGLRDREMGLPFDEHTRFAIGSTSKAFTALTVALLADDGLLELDEPVRTHLPDFETADPAVTSGATPIDLLSHRTGLSPHNMWWYFVSRTREEIYRALPTFSDLPDERMGETWVYNNEMFLVASVLVERVSGERWEDVLDTRVLAPLGMSETTVGEIPLFAHPNHAVGYRRTERMPYYRSCPAVAAAGCINSTPTDMAKWLSFLLARGRTASGEQLVSDVGFDALTSPHNTVFESFPGTRSAEYGLGWHVWGFDDFELIDHGGGLQGYRAYVSFSPELDAGVVLLANDHGSTLGMYVARAIYRELLPLAGRPRNALDTHYEAFFSEPPPPESPTPPSLAGATVLGRFRHPTYGELVSYRLPSGGYAVTVLDQTWPVDLAPEGYYVAHAPFSGVVHDLALVADLSGTEVRGVWATLSTAPVYFARAD